MISNFSPACLDLLYFTILSEPAIPVASPFLDAYHFVYNNNSGGACVNHENYAQQCASPAKFSFQFKKCNPAYVAYTSDRGKVFVYNVPVWPNSPFSSRPRIIKHTHVGHWGMALTGLTFGVHDLIFKVTRCQCLWNLSSRTDFMKTVRPRHTKLH